MKKIIQLAILLQFTITSFAIGDKGLESVLAFQIKSRKTDTSIPYGKTKFKFKFVDDNRQILGNIAIGFNDSSLYLRTNNAGEITTSIKSGKYVMYFYLDEYEEVITDSIEVKSQELIEAEIHFTSADPNIIITVDKPVIYLYPEKETKVDVKLTVVGELAFTYPAYNNGWNVTASPNGNITLEGKDYNYLFWDSKMNAYNLKPKNNEGFLVASDTLLSFLENSLNTMGLNSKESADFITFWYPRMQMNEKNYVSFLFNEDCNAYAELNISPKPDKLFRVGMLWANTQSDIIPTPQKIENINRNGFTVIEWGGTELQNMFSPNH